MDFARILALHLLIISCVRAMMVAYMDTIECPNYLPEMISNHSCHLDRTSQSNATLSVEFALAQDVKDIKGAYTFSMIRGSSISNYMTVKLDFCEALSSLLPHFLLNAIASEIRKKSNFPLHCPFKMNKRYFINKFTIDPKVIPSYTPEMNFKTDCEINFKKRKALQLIIRGHIARRRSGR